MTTEYEETARRVIEVSDLWRAEDPKRRGHQIPGLGALLTWLLDRVSRAEEEAEAVLNNERARQRRVRSERLRELTDRVRELEQAMEQDREDRDRYQGWFNEAREKRTSERAQLEDLMQEYQRLSDRYRKLQREMAMAGATGDPPVMPKPPSHWVEDHWNEWVGGKRAAEIMMRYHRVGDQEWIRQREADSERMPPVGEAEGAGSDAGA